MNKILLLCALAAAFVISASAQNYTSSAAKKAGEKLSKGDRSGAIEVLDEAIRKNNDLLDAYQFRGDLRAMTGDLDGAIADFTAALELNPTNGPVYARRANFRMFKRDSAGALKDFDLAIAHGSRTERNLVGRANVKRDIGDDEGAISDLQAALAMNPNHAAAHIALSFAHERRGDMNAAILQLQDFLDRYEGKRDGKLPVAPKSDGTVSTVIKREGTDKDGSQTFLTASGMTKVESSTITDPEQMAAKMEQVKNIGLAYITLGRHYIKKGDLDAALANIEKGLTVTSEDAIGYQLRSQIRIKKGNLAGAVSDLNTFLNSRMRPPTVHVEKAILYTLQGRDDEAEKELDLHLKVFPTAKREMFDARIEEAKKLREQQEQK